MLNILMVYAKVLVAWFIVNKNMIVYVEVWWRDAKVNIFMVNVKVQVWGSKLKILIVYVIKLSFCLPSIHHHNSDATVSRFKIAYAQADSLTPAW